METKTSDIPIIQKSKITKVKAVESPSSCCTPTNDASVCCTPSQSAKENSGACCAQPANGAPCCDK